MSESTTRRMMAESGIDPASAPELAGLLERASATTATLRPTPSAELAAAIRRLPTRRRVSTGFVALVAAAGMGVAAPAAATVLGADLPSMGGLLPGGPHHAGATPTTPVTEKPAHEASHRPATPRPTVLPGAPVASGGTAGSSSSRPSVPSGSGGAAPSHDGNGKLTVPVPSAPDPDAVVPDAPSVPVPKAPALPGPQVDVPRVPLP